MRAIVVGAGISGLLAARDLTAAGHDTLVVDKGRGPGGRLATRRIGSARVDHGAQFFTVRDDGFGVLVEEWSASGLVYEWCRGFADGGDGYPRYAVRGGMNALAKHIAGGLDVRCSTMAFAVRRADAGGWALQLDDGAVLAADALIITCPVPQAFSLLVSAEVELPEQLFRTEYDRTLALLATLDRPSAVPAPGGVQGAPHFTFIADNATKGISAAPAITAHADPAWSEAHWNDDHHIALAELEEMARPWLGDAVVVERQLKRWRFATPRTIWPERCWTPAGGDHPPVAVAGDAFAGPRVEGAALSGRAAAAAIMAG